MKRILSLFLGAVFVLSGPFVFAQTPSLRVSVILKGDGKGDIKKPGDTFVVATKIINMSAAPQTITVWSCGYDMSWEVSSGVLIQSIACDKNYPENIVLEPKGEYSRDLELVVPVGAKSGPVVFKLGFDPKSAAEFANRVIDRVIWSDPLLIRIRE